MYQLWPRKAQFMTILTFSWPLWPWPSTYKKNVTDGIFLLDDSNCAKLFWNPCINVQVMALTSSIYNHFDLYLTPVPLTFNLHEKMFQRAFYLLKDNTWAILFLKFIHKCTCHGPDKLNIWPFWLLFEPCDLDLQPTWKNVSHGTSPLRGQQLCRFFLKSIHKCTSYAPDNLNSCIRPFWPLFDPCDLDLQPTKKCFKRHFSSSRATTVPNCFEIHA